ncbi:ABC transporter permease subunit [Methyloglobulus sp.]|uniref:ABC transporter permease subunit n=1 Tax=Methyloglobulus sp. TaxID=2518622 RepID=UPI003988DC47
MKTALWKLALVRLAAILLTMALLPLIPIAAVKLGFTSPEYLHRGVLQGPASTGTETSIVQAYVETTQGLMTATLGNSLATGLPVGRLLKGSLEATAPILGIALLLSMSIGLLLGIAAVLGRGGVWLLSVAMVVACVPIVVLAYLALEWLGAYTENAVIRLLVPAVLLCLYPAYLIAGTTRATLADLSASENAQFLRACGFSEQDILVSQAPKPLLLRLLALVYPSLLYGLSFCFFVEAPFGIPGFGQRFLNAVQALDYPVIIGFSLSGFLLLTVVELALALVQAACDPRLRHG